MHSWAEPRPEFPMFLQPGFSLVFHILVLAPSLSMTWRFREGACQLYLLASWVLEYLVFHVPKRQPGTCRAPSAREVWPERRCKAPRLSSAACTWPPRTPPWPAEQPLAVGGRCGSQTAALRDCDESSHLQLTLKPYERDQMQHLLLACHMPASLLWLGLKVAGRW